MNDEADGAVKVIEGDLGVGRMRLMSSPQRFHCLGSFGLSIEEYVHE